MDIGQTLKPRGFLARFAHDTAALRLPAGST